MVCEKREGDEADSGGHGACIFFRGGQDVRELSLLDFFSPIRFCLSRLPSSASKHMCSRFQQTKG